MLSDERGPAGHTGGFPSCLISLILLISSTFFLSLQEGHSMQSSWAYPTHSHLRTGHMLYLRIRERHRRPPLTPFTCGYWSAVVAFFILATPAFGRHRTHLTRWK